MKSTQLILYLLGCFSCSATQQIPCDANMSCESGVDDAKTILLQTAIDADRKAHISSDNTKPWDQHLYWVGVYHKAGSQVLRNVMRKAFDALGATSSCRECPTGESYITTKGSHHIEGNKWVPNKCFEGYPSPIHWNNCAAPSEFLARARELAGESGMRAVRIIRDPLEMVASAYCYHNAGNEMPGSPYAPENIMELSASEGVPPVADLMLSVIHPMVETNRIAFQNDTFTIKYEDVTRSSADFDAIMSDAFDFLFEDSITANERTEIEALARTEDLNSEFYDGLSNEEHVSAPECKDEARAALTLMDPELYETYQEYRIELGYASE